MIMAAMTQEIIEHVQKKNKVLTTIRMITKQLDEEQGNPL